MPVSFMIGISFSLFIVFSFAFIMNPLHHVHAFSSILFFSTLKIRIHVFRQIRCRPQSVILRALWTSVLTRMVKTMLFDSTIHEMMKIAVRIEMNDFIIRARWINDNGVDSSISAFFRYTEQCFQSRPLTRVEMSVFTVIIMLTWMHNQWTYHWLLHVI